MKEHNLGRDEIAANEDLIDIGRPCGMRLFVKIEIECDVAALLSQARRGVELGFGIGPLPFAQENVMQ